MQIQDVLYYVVWAGLFFLMMRYGCGAHIMGHRHHHNSHVPTQSLPPNVLPPVPDQAKDPVCGMTVETSAAKTAVYKGQNYYFCSQRCREKFEASPELYTRPGSVVALQKEHHHG